MRGIEVVLQRKKSIHFFCTGEVSEVKIYKRGQASFHTEVWKGRQVAMF